jgi:prolycopene isomerase
MSHRIFGREYPERVDALVIGGGVGGLTLANLLADGGLKVLLIERHWMLGGFCSTFRRRGFIFDAATHFYPLLGNPATLTGRILEKLKIPTEWVKMDPVDRFHIPGLDPFDVPADFDPYLARLKQVFPGEQAAIGAYFSELRQAYLYGLLYYFRGVDDARARRWENLTVEDKLSQHFRDPRLRTLLMADNSHWGAVPGRTSFMFDAMLRLSYFLGNYYPKGSSQQFVDDLGQALEDRGGWVARCVEAERILIENGRAVGVEVRTAAKREPERFIVRADYVVSNGDALHTYRDLIPETPPALIARLGEMTPSHPCFLVHIGLRGIPQQQLNRIEGYYWDRCDPSAVLDTVFKIFTTTRFDPTLAPPDCATLIVQKVTPRRVEPGVDWEAHKAEVENYIMGRLRQILPGIDDHIVLKLSATSRTAFRYTMNLHGAMLGWEMSPDQLGAGRLPNETPFENFYMVGHWTRPGGGITPVMIGAQQVAGQILTGRAAAEPDPFFAAIAGIQSRLPSHT